MTRLCIDVYAEYDLGSHNLYKFMRLVHRDISISNLAYVCDSGEVVGILIDFELASFVGEVRSGADHQSGTAPFMA